MGACDAGIGACTVGLIFGFRAPYEQIANTLLQGLWPASYWRVVQEGIEFIIESTFASTDYLHTLAQRNEAEDSLEEARHEIFISAYEQLRERGDYDEANIYNDSRIEEAEQSCKATLVRLRFRLWYYNPRQRVVGVVYGRYHLIILTFHELFSASCNTFGQIRHLI